MTTLAEVRAAKLATGRPMPTHRRVFPPITHRSQELAMAFREAVAMVHESGVEHPRRFAKHDAIEDADYACRNGWCVRFWAMVREAEAAADPDVGEGGPA